MRQAKAIRTRPISAGPSHPAGLSTVWLHEVPNHSARPHLLRFWEGQQRR